MQKNHPLFLLILSTVFGFPLQGACTTALLPYDSVAAKQALSVLRLYCPKGVQHIVEYCQLSQADKHTRTLPACDIPGINEHSFFIVARNHCIAVTRGKFITHFTGTYCHNQDLIFRVHCFENSNSRGSVLVPFADSDPLQPYTPAHDPEINYGIYLKQIPFKDQTKLCDVEISDFSRTLGVGTAITVSTYYSQIAITAYALAQEFKSSSRILDEEKHQKVQYPSKLRSLL